MGFGTFLLAQVIVFWLIFHHAEKEGTDSNNNHYEDECHDGACYYLFYFHAFGLTFETADIA